MAQNTKGQETANLGDSFFNTWTSGLDNLFASRKELESLLIQALETQRQTLEKVTADFSRIEEEQKKLIEELRESIKLNIQKIFGTQAGKAYEQWNAQFDEIASRVQQLTVTPYKEGISIINQSQEQFQESIKKGIDQQQKLREGFAEQVKSTQKIFIDLFETNSKLALGLFK